MFDVYLCGGDCVEDVNRSDCHLRDFPNSLPTSHTIGRAIKELVCSNTEYKSSAGNVFRFNVNSRLYDLLMKLNMRMGLLRQGQVVDVDFDHVFVRTEKADARYSYKQAFGYFPGVVSMDGVIAYIENRDGNTPVKFHQADTLTRISELLRSKWLVINIFCADCGSYAEDIIRAVDANCRVFYIRVLHSAAMYAHIEDISVWKSVQISLQDT